MEYGLSHNEVCFSLQGGSVPQANPGSVLGIQGEPDYSHAVYTNKSSQPIISETESLAGHLKAKANHVATHNAV